MTQEQIYDFLDKHKGRRFNAKQISQALNISNGSVNKSLKSLRKTIEIKYHKITEPPIIYYEYWIER